eukprot:EG_transcript_19398
MPLGGGRETPQPKSASLRVQPFRRVHSLPTSTPCRAPVVIGNPGQMTSKTRPATPVQPHSSQSQPQSRQSQPPTSKLTALAHNSCNPPMGVFGASNTLKRYEKAYLGAKENEGTLCFMGFINKIVQNFRVKFIILIDFEI